MRPRARLALIVLGAGLGVLLLTAGALWVWGWRTPDYPPPALAGEWHEDVLVVDGIERHYAWYRPLRLAEPAPVVLLLHGAAANGDRMRRATGWAFDELADQHGFISVYPDGLAGYWNDCRAAGDFEAKRRNVQDVKFLQTVVSALGREVPVDRRANFAFGLSNGGQMALRLALEAPEWVAGVAVVAAALPAPANSVCKPKRKATAVLLIDGTADPISPYDGGQVRLFGAFGARGVVESAESTVEFFRQRAGHGSPPFRHHYPDADPADGTVAFRQVWSSEDRPEVALITIYDGGHTIPHPRKTFPRVFGRTSHDLSAAEESVRFFQRQMSGNGGFTMRQLAAGDDATHVAAGSARRLH